MGRRVPGTGNKDFPRALEAREIDGTPSSRGGYLVKPDTPTTRAGKVEPSGRQGEGCSNVQWGNYDVQKRRCITLKWVRLREKIPAKSGMAPPVPSKPHSHRCLPGIQSKRGRDEKVSPL